jgi:hypothetical protein
MMTAGHDACPPRVNITLSAAEQLCIALPDCVGFTFSGNNSKPIGKIPKVFFKNVTAVAGGGGKWSTCLLDYATPWYTSEDGGESWSRFYTNTTLGTVPNGSFGHSFLSTDSLTRQSLGTLTSQALNKSVLNYSHFSGSSPAQLVLDPATGQITSQQLTDTKLSISGIPSSLGLHGQLRFTGVSSIAQLRDGSMVISAMTLLPPPHANTNPAIETYSLVAFRSTDGGFNWIYASIIADPSHFPTAEEGPSENGLVVLDDGSNRVACVFRIDGGDGHPTHQMLPYGIAFSVDGGVTWTKPKMLAKGIGCACPQLMSIPGGGLLIAGGRTSSHNEDVLVFVNAAGDGEEWVPHSISYWHNKLAGIDAHSQSSGVYPFDALINSSTFPRESTSYTSLVQTSTTSAVLLYSQWLKPGVAGGGKWRGYSMRISITRSDTS